MIPRGYPLPSWHYILIISTRHPVADLHRSKRSSAWGPSDSRGPKFTKWLRNNDNTEHVWYNFNEIIDLVGVWGGRAPQSQLLGAALDLNLALETSWHQVIWCHDCPVGPFSIEAQLNVGYLRFLVQSIMFQYYSIYSTPRNWTMDIALFILMALIHKSIQEFINLLFQSYYPIIEHAQFILCSYNTDHFTLFVWVISSSSSSSCNLFSALILRQCSDSMALLQA